MGEGLALRWIDYNEAEREISVSHILFHLQLKSPKTKSSRRKFKLAPAVAGLIEAHKQQSGFQALDDFIFCRANGKPLDSSALRVHLYKAMDAVGIHRTKGHYGYHIFRHSAGTLIYSRSRDLKLVQGTLGHSDISTTSDIYVHFEEKVLEEGTEILAREILGNCDLFVTSESRMVS